MRNLFNRKELIYTIYQERSFSRAAQKLFISQPSLSAMVKKTEEEIGVPLFDRTNKPIRLTEAGKEFISTIEKIRYIEKNFENYLSALNNLEAGTLGIGSNQLLSTFVLPRYISQFMQTYPKIKLSLTDANSITLENQIISGALDVVVDNHILPEDVFEQKHIATEHLLLAVPARFSENEAAANYQLTYHDILFAKHLQSEKPAPLSLFASVPFILMNRDNDTRKLTDTIFKTEGFNPKVLLEMDRLTTLYTYVQMGTAASIVSDTLVKYAEPSSSVLFYTLPSLYAKRDIFASYKRNKYYSKAMATFIESLGDLK